MKKWMPIVAGLSLSTSIQAQQQDKFELLSRIGRSVAVTYTSLMLTTLAHEYGHALVYWFNNIPSRVIINANQKRIQENREKLYIESELQEDEEGVSFPSCEINLMPSLYSVCIAKKKIDDKTQDILCSAAGPLAGAATSVLLRKLFPSIFTSADCYAGVIGDLINFVPFKLFGLETDGYQILKKLEILK